MRSALGVRVTRLAGHQRRCQPCCWKPRRVFVVVGAQLRLHRWRIPARCPRELRTLMPALCVRCTMAHTPQPSRVPGRRPRRPQQARTRLERQSPGVYAGRPRQPQALPRCGHYPKPRPARKHRCIGRAPPRSINKGRPLIVIGMRSSSSLTDGPTGRRVRERVARISSAAPACSTTRCPRCSSLARERAGDDLAERSGFAQGRGDVSGPPIDRHETLVITNGGMGSLCRIPPYDAQYVAR